MPEPSFKLRDVAWNELVPWVSLSRCVWIALMPRVLFLGAVGLVLVTAGWQVISSGFQGSDNPVLQEWLTVGCAWAWQDAAQFAVAAADSPRSARELFATTFQELINAPIFLWRHLTRPFMLSFDGQVSFTGLWCLLLCGIWEILVWALIGGTISRIAALRLTRGETPDIVQAMRFASRLLLSYCAAPLMALSAAVVFAIFLTLIGSAMRIDVIALLVALGWPLVLFFGFLMALLLIGLLIGWPFMWATISVEGTDAFDAVSRCYAYAYQRPFHLIWYVLFAGGLGALGMFAVRVFVVASIALGDWSIHWGLDQMTFDQVVDLDPSAGRENVPPPSGMLAIAHMAIHFWKGLLATVAAGYQVSFLWTAAVGIYLLLRRDIDSAEMDEVFVDDEEPEFGMPPLEEDESGVPAVATTAPAQPGDT
jgi:hypothetical protein